MRRCNNAFATVGLATLFVLTSAAAGALPREAWVGERVVFQDEQVNREIGFQQYRWTPEPTEGHCRYGDLAGKPATVVAAREVEPGRWLVTIELDSSKRRVYTDVAGFALRNVGFLSEAESARQWVGRTFYNRVHGPRATGHARNRVYAWRPLEELAARPAGDSGHAEVPLDNLEPVELVEVPGWLGTKLVFRLRRADGTEVYWLGSATAINDLDWESYPHFQFRHRWWPGDPLAGKPSWPPAMKTAIRNGEVLAGMTEEMVRLSWGEPKQVSRTGFEKGPDELWVYGEPRLAVVFTDGLVTGFKD